MSNGHSQDEHNDVLREADSMKNPQSAIDEAVEEWLESYRGHERYLAATERLFTVFAQSWQGSRRYVAEAFTEFRTALLTENGHEHIDAVKVFQKPSTGRE